MGKSRRISEYVHVGCGSSLVEGWLNIDNSPSIMLARWPFLLRWLKVLRLITVQQQAFAQNLNGKAVMWVDCSRALPFSQNSVSAIYSCHVVEHLSRAAADSYFKEAYRVLKPGGVIRTIVPDLRCLVESYVDTGDAETFMNAMMVAPKSLKGLAGAVELMLVGHRNHQWMYDANSLLLALQNAGFVQVMEVPWGETSIEAPGALDLKERCEGSIVVEAVKT